jgi:hypothetical protein
MGTVATDIKTGIASEGGHWYAVDGTPVYQVPRADGKGYRDATLRDARKMILLPGITSAMNVMAKPGLERWKQENLLLAAATLPKRDGEGVEEWMQRVREDAWKQGEDARNMGTAVHKAIEIALQGGEPAEHWHLAEPAVQWCLMMFPDHEHLVESSFADVKLGIGCRIDFGAKGNRPALVDFKTTDKSLDNVKAWPEHSIQLAAQALLAFGTLEVDCYNLMVSTRGPGIVPIKHDPKDIKLAARKLTHLVALWQLDKNYFPELEYASRNTVQGQLHA